MDTTELDTLNETSSRVQISCSSNRDIPNIPVVNPLRKQFLATCWCITGSISFGITNGFTATLFPQIRHLTGENKEFTESWLASTIVISMISGVFLSGFLLKSFGRRRPIIFCSIPWFLGWPSMFVANTLSVLFIGCFLVGLSSGLFSAMSNLYIVEISDARTRALVGVWVSIGVSVGIFITHVMGIIMIWQHAVLLSTIFPSITFVLSLRSPETPSWLVTIGNIEEARNTFLKLRGHNRENLEEFDKFLSKRENDMKRKSQGVAINLASRNFLLPFLITCLLFTAQQGSGVNMITFYAIDILKRIFSSLDPNMVILQVDAIRIISCAVSVYCVKKIQRRKLFFATAMGTVMSLMAIVYLMKFQMSDEMLIIAMAAYMFFVYCGVLPIAWLLVGELYPDVVRDIGISTSTLYAFFSMLMVVKSGPFLVHTIGLPNTLLVYASIVVTCSIFLYFLMPETRNISLVEIEKKVTNCP